MDIIRRSSALAARPTRRAVVGALLEIRPLRRWAARRTRLARWTYCTPTRRRANSVNGSMTLDAYEGGSHTDSRRG
jgi:hypothetical protein